MSITTALSLISDSFTFFVIFPSILLLGIYLTVRLRFIQFSKLKESLKKLFDKTPEGDGITHYQAVAAVLAGNFGTGNISGMAIAIATGGPGALIWMWVIAFLGAAIQYASCVLGVKYREQNAQGERVGGPMYYLAKGLNLKKFGAIYAIFALLGGLTAGNFTQVNSIMLPMQELGIPAIATALTMTFFVGLVLLGGIQRFAKLAASVVPVMALVYFSTALLILGIHSEMLLPALKQIFIEAFAPSALLGGSMGYGIMKTISSGFDRGIFATDAGTGIAPILQSSTQSKDPISNGIVTLITPVLVMIVCTMTGLVIMVTGMSQSDLQSTNMVTAAFTKGLGSHIGGHIVTLSLLLFSYTTILAWANCSERAIGYLLGDGWIKRFRLFFIAMVPFGAFCEVSHVWLLADISFSLMLLTNMIGVAGLSREVIKDTRRLPDESLNQNL